VVCALDGDDLIAITVYANRVQTPLRPDQG
jgi:hypothetical protein